MKKLLIFLFLLIFCKLSIHAHSVQVAWGYGCGGTLRVYFEHWHSTENPATTTMTLQLTVGSTVTNMTKSPDGSLQNVPIASLPSAGNVVGGCSGQANTYNDWVYYDFVVPCATPIFVKIISGNTVFTQDGCNMYPLTIGPIIIPCDIPIPVPNQTVCSGDNFSPTVFPVIAGNVYTWTNNNTSIGLPANGTGNIASFVGNNNTSTVQTSTISLYVNGCVDTTFTLTVNPKPAIVVTDPPAVCFPSTVDITTASVTLGSTNIGALTYWTDSLATTSLVNPTSISSNGTYYIKSTNSYGCSSIESVSVLINSLPIISITNPPAVCIPNTVDITAAAITLGTIGTGTFSYWNNAAATSSLTNPNAIGTSGTYYIKLTTATGCIDIQPVVVTITPLPVLNIANPAAVCFPAGVDITIPSVTVGTIGTGNLTYWTDAAATIPLNNPNAITSSGTYYIMIGNLSGCNDIKPVIVTINPKPLANFSVDVPKGCPVHCVNFTDLSTVAATNTITSWSWNFGDGQSSSSRNPSNCFANTGFYDVSLIVTSNRGCSDSITMPALIEVYPLPVAAFKHSPENPSILNPVVNFINQSSADVVYWEWDFGDNTTLSNTITPNPTHKYSEQVGQIYTVQLIVENSYGCRDTIAQPVEIGTEFTFFIPNAFTPNGDGINDSFFGQGIGIINYDMQIYDRWGNMIFHGTDINSKWDGKANYGDEIAQQDVYVWKISVLDVFNKKHNYMGTVALIK